MLKKKVNYLYYIQYYYVYLLFIIQKLNNIKFKDLYFILLFIFYIYLNKNKKKKLKKLFKDIYNDTKVQFIYKIKKLARF